MFGMPGGAHRCSTCNLNYPTPGKCTVCREQLTYLANAKVTEDLAEVVEHMMHPKEFVPEEETIFLWRRDQLFAAGYPWDYAVRMAKDREFDLHHCRALLEATAEKHGPMQGLDLALEILL